jgi:hypothetical protein
MRCMFLDIGPKLQYNLLCDGLPEDKQLREQLQMNKLVGKDYAQQHINESVEKCTKYEKPTVSKPYRLRNESNLQSCRDSSAAL